MEPVHSADVRHNLAGGISAVFHGPSHTLGLPQDSARLSSNEKENMETSSLGNIQTSKAKKVSGRLVYDLNSPSMF